MGQFRARILPISMALVAIAIGSCLIFLGIIPNRPWLTPLYVLAFSSPVFFFSPFLSIKQMFVVLAALFIFYAIFFPIVGKFILDNSTI
jgi:hypothetical protein